MISGNLGCTVLRASTQAFGTHDLRSSLAMGCIIESSLSCASILKDENGAGSEVACSGSSQVQELRYMPFGSGATLHQRMVRRGSTLGIRRWKPCQWVVSLVKQSKIHAQAPGQTCSMSF